MLTFKVKTANQKMSIKNLFKTQPQTDLFSDFKDAFPGCTFDVKERKAIMTCCHCDQKITIDISVKHQTTITTDKYGPETFSTKEYVDPPLKPSQIHDCPIKKY